jgi:hypothetical protein
VWGIHEVMRAIRRSERQLRACHSCLQPEQSWPI